MSVCNVHCLERLPQFQQCEIRLPNIRETFVTHPVSIPSQPRDHPNDIHHHDERGNGSQDGQIHLWHSALMEEPWNDRGLGSTAP